MLTIASLLQRGWHVTAKNRRYSASDVAQIANQAAAQIVMRCAKQHIPASGLFIFLIRNNMEGMFCFFIASLLKVKAAIINVRDVEMVQHSFDQEVIAAWVVSQDSATAALNKKVLTISFSHYNAFDSGAIAAFSSSHCAHFYFMTSGTTGKPKMVQYQETKLTGNALQVSKYLQLTSADNTICFFPVQYMYGLSTMLSSFIAQSGLVFEHYLLSNVSEMLHYYAITTLPLIGDWMIPLSNVLKVDGKFINRVLNASDRLLTAQAEKILSCCEVLWNNFGQTESGPRLFCQKLESSNDIQNYSRNCIVAPGCIMADEIEIQLRVRDHTSDKACQMFYRTPFAADGYVDERLSLSVWNGWIASGDLFEKDESGRYYWISREKNEIKVNGKFVPTQCISNQIINELGHIRHNFSNGAEGIINLNVESVSDPEIIMKLSCLLSQSWYHYRFDIRVMSALPVTHTGKIKTALV